MGFLRYASISLGEMLVGVYMVYAEAVEAGAAGAVAELKLRIRGVGAPADLAAAGVVLCSVLVVDAVHFPLEVHGVFALAA